MGRVVKDQDLEFVIISGVAEGDRYINCNFKHVIFDEESKDLGVIFEHCDLEDVIFPGGLTFGPDGVRFSGMRRF